MKMRNKSNDTVILGGVFNGRYSETPIILHPGQCEEISDERLALYDADVQAKLVPASRPLPAAPAPTAPKAPEPTQEELEASLMAARLTAARAE